VISHSRFSIVALCTIAASLILANNAMAYVGPGAGMEFITYAMSLLAMVGVAFFSIFMWPFYTFVRWLRGSKKAAATEPAPTSTPAAEVCSTAQLSAIPENVPTAPQSQPAP
jgi:hypothetical protein